MMILELFRMSLVHSASIRNSWGFVLWSLFKEIMSKFSTCDYVPTLEWWSFDVPAMKFKNEEELDGFYEKVCFVMSAKENNLSGDAYAQRKIYADYKSQDQPFDKFFESHKDYYYGEESGIPTCLGRAVEIKRILCEALISTYPETEKCVYVASTTLWDSDLNSEGEPSEFFHIYNFMAHCMPVIKCALGKRTAHVIFDEKLLFDNPFLIFENETKEFKSRSKHRTMCKYLGPNYVEIKKLLTTEEKTLGRKETRSTVFVGGAIVNLDGVMKLTCLPFIPFYKYRIKDGITQAMIVFSLDKDYVRFTRTNLYSDYSYKKIPVSYFQDSGLVVEEFEEEIKETSLLLDESYEKIVSYLHSLVRIKGDEKFLKEMRLFKESLIRKRHEYVTFLSSNLTK